MEDVEEAHVEEAVEDASLFVDDGTTPNPISAQKAASSSILVCEVAVVELLVLAFDGG